MMPVTAPWRSTLPRDATRRCKRKMQFEPVVFESQSNPPPFMTVADFLEGAEDCRLVQELFDELEAEDGGLKLAGQGCSE